MSDVKTNAEMLVTIKQCNKVVREARAKRLGFPTSKALIAHLDAEIAKGNKDDFFGIPVASKPPAPTSSGKTRTKAKPSEPVSIPTIHVVDILDASGSMMGGKFGAALAGINSGIKQLNADTANVKYTYTLCDFSDEVIFKYITSSLTKVDTIKGNTRASTALFDAIGSTIAKVTQNIKSGDKVLVNIYTDGQENSSRRYKGIDVSNAIAELSKKGWTFTFIGMEEDVRYAQERLNFHSSNTLVYDGTPQGLEKSFVANNLSRSAYSHKVAKGEDVSTGFYKDIK